MGNRTADVATILEGEYGHLQDQNLHIEYFFLILGTKLVGKRDEIIATLGGTRVWDTLGKKGPQLLFSTTKRSKSPFETERQREERLNKEIRTQLAEPKSDPKNPSTIVICVDPNDPSIIVSRACKYNKQVVKHSLSTPEIQNVLKTPSDEHLDYFYLMITQTILHPKSHYPRASFLQHLSLEIGRQWNRKPLGHSHLLAISPKNHSKQSVRGSGD